MDDRGRLAAEIRAGLIERRRAGAGTDQEGIEQAIRHAVEARAVMLSEAAQEDLVERILREASGLGPLEVLLDDGSVEEVMVNGPDLVYVERGGKIEPAGVRFEDEEQLRNTIERILAPLGRRVDELSPMADARLPDGSRVNVVIPPLAVDGPAVSIRRFPGRRPTVDDLVQWGTLSAGQAERLGREVAARRSILISGGTGSGKTTLLNALSGFIDAAERIVTIEDAAELSLAQPHVVRLESRPPSIEGRGEVTIRDLLRNALRMRPDRILIGEVRGAEALDLLTALNTGHDGALSTVHASSATDALARIEVLALMADVGLPLNVIGAQLRRGIDLVVHISRTAEGGRKVTEIEQVGQ
ncbi:MAG TPA: CpaF family protein [Solirubrobacterales bacterium]|jgi:pilus assembly protein CpaF|nr:CpaF family protein [Solirubrobacterales bacterium]HMU26666.1 CpaF family protein [Solirubrobacterales bacterium]HMW45881.1 CpaF family protein [Solirubrobacterales bacterium]HNA44018.1 CpaF family protein [Solirubrobacterales bacterium]HNC05453.1 CpaF family protein [Solirubrobacterales bacterium]